MENKEIIKNIINELFMTKDEVENFLVNALISLNQYPSLKCSKSEICIIKDSMNSFKERISSLEVFVNRLNKE